MAVEIESPGELLTVADVARRLQVSRITVRRWCQTGQLSHTRIGPLGDVRLQHIRVDSRELDAFLAARRRPR